MVSNLVVNKFQYSENLLLINFMKVSALWCYLKIGFHIFIFLLVKQLKLINFIH